jgi:hypothetical protein
MATDPGDIESLSRRKAATDTKNYNTDSDCVDTSELGLAERSLHFMFHDGESLPTPQIHSKGVVATEITDHFIKATTSAWCLNQK